MAEDRRPERRTDPSLPDGENPYVPPSFYLALVAVLALVIFATIL